MYKVPLNVLIDLRNHIISVNKILVNATLTKEIEKVILDNLAHLEYINNLIGESDE